MWRIFTLVFVVISLAEVVLARFTSWLSPAIQTTLLALAPPAALAVGLVAYFDWRAGLKRRTVADTGREEEPARAA